MAKKGKGGDYEGWVLRLIEKMEELDFALSQKSWLDFAAEKIEPLQKYPLTDRQVGILEEYRVLAFKVPEALGGTYESFSKLKGPVKARYRDTEGRWGKKGTWVSAANMNAYLAELKSKKTIKLGDLEE